MLRALLTLALLTSILSYSPVALTQETITLLLQRLRTEDCLFDSFLDADLASFGALNHALLDLEVRGLVSCRGGRYTIA